jgi:hypothetical protein
MARHPDDVALRGTQKWFEAEEEYLKASNAVIKDKPASPQDQFWMAAASLCTTAEKALVVLLEAHGPRSADEAPRAAQSDRDSLWFKPSDRVSWEDPETLELRSGKVVKTFRDEQTGEQLARIHLDGRPPIFAGDLVYSKHLIRLG